MLRFLDCFYRDRRLLMAITAVAVLLTVGFVASRPTTYEVTARVWADPSVQGEHPNPYITPADGANLILGENLRTRSFATRVARRGGLVAAPASPTRRGEPPVDDGVLTPLNAGIVLGTTGPNIVTITFRHTDPKVAVRTVQAIVALFGQQVMSTQADRARQTVSFYTQQVKSARAELSRADTKISDYLGASSDASAGPLGLSAAPDPGATVPGGTSDVALLALQRDDDSIRTRVDDLTQKLNQAKLDLNSAQQATPNGFRVIDSPGAPQRTGSRMRSLLAAVVGGLAVGVLLSLLVLTALTAVDRSVRYGSEVERTLGLRVVGSVPYRAA